jgi:A/G-specific adenine glycosylase
VRDEEAIKQFRRKILSWYRRYGRHFPWRNASANTFQRIVSEVLLQRTRAETVAAFFPSFIKKYPSWQKLAMAREDELGAVLKPLGLWKRRSVSLLRLAKEMADRHGRFPRCREKIEHLPNVGQYIANAILLFCYKHPEPLLDANMARVLERHFGPRKLADIRYDPYLQDLCKRVVNCKASKELNWAILDLAATVCQIVNPTCEICPLKNQCKYGMICN